MIEEIVKNCVTNAGIYPKQDRLIDIRRPKVPRRNIDELSLDFLKLARMINRSTLINPKIQASINVMMRS